MIRATLLLAAICLAPSASADEPIPVADFARDDDVMTAKISPGGEHVGILTRLRGEYGIVVIGLKDMKRTGAMVFGHGGFPADFVWVGSQRLVAELAIDSGQLDQPYLTGELFAMDADGDNRKYLFGYRGKKEEIGTRLNPGATYERAWARVVDPMPDDPLRALIEVRPWYDRSSASKDASPLFQNTLPVFELLNVVTGARERVAASPVLDPDVVADSRGQPLFVVGSNREGQQEAWYRPDASGAWTRIAIPGGPREVRTISVHRSGAAAYLAFAAGGAASCVHQFRFKQKDFVRVSCGPADPTTILSNADRHPVALRYEGGTPQMAYPDPEHPEARLLRSLQNSFPNQRLSNVSVSNDGMKMLVLVDSDRSAGDYYLVNRASKKVDLLLSRKSWIDPSRMQPTEAIVVKARDGTSVPGYLTVRGGLGARQAPMVVLPHDGPHGARDFWRWDPVVQLLASRGYAVLQLNYRGSGGYGDAYEQAGYRKWGSLMQDDLADAAKWAVAQRIADPARICISGWGYGGYAALMSATREPTLYRCAIALNGMYDLAEQVGDTLIADSRLGRAYLQRALGSDAAALREQSPVTHVARLRAPVLIAHGTANLRVPFSQARLLRGALDKAGKAYEWVEYPGEEYGLYQQANREDFYNRLLAFLDKHIGAGAAAPPAAP